MKKLNYICIFQQAKLYFFCEYKDFQLQSNIITYLHKTARKFLASMINMTIYNHLCGY